MSDARNSLKTNSKSFYWAALLLPRKTRDDVQLLYAYCREMDDAVDEHNAPEIVRDSLEKHNDGVGELSALLKEYEIPPAVMQSFLQGLLDDTTPVKHTEISSVLKFGYHVAGTVGIMMCHILGRKEATTIYYAIDLGVAMQLVNIARDRADDMRIQRDYIPADYDQKALVQLAEKYFASGLLGVHKLPIAMRPAIMTAAYVYRAIGRKIIRNLDYAKDNRTVVSKAQKAWLTIFSLAACLRTPKNSKHDSSLHAAFKDMCYTDGGE